MSTQTQDILTVKEVMEILRIGSNNAYALIHSNSFPVIKIGHTYRIPRTAFYAWLETCGQAAKP